MTRLPVWRDRAACRPGSGARPQDFSPEDARGRVRLDDARRTARDWCARCPVVDTCLSAALAERAAGRGPQGLVLGGVWFPADTASDQNLIDLLAIEPSGVAA